MPTKWTLTRQRDQARRGRETAIEQRDEAREERDSAFDNQRAMARQLTEAREDLARLGKELDSQPASITVAALARLRQRLDLSERARASLDGQLVQLGQVNDRITRDAYDHAVAEEAVR